MKLSEDGKVTLVLFIVVVVIVVTITVLTNRERIERENEEAARTAWFHANNCKRVGYVGNQYGATPIYDCNGVQYIWDHIPKK